MALPNLVDLKTHLNYDATDTTDDDELEMTLDAAIGVVENMVGPLAGAPVTETHYGVSSPVLVLRQVPVLSLTSISARSWPGSVPADGNVGDYVLDVDLGTLRTATGLQFYGDVTVSYTAGRTDVPPAVRLGTLIIAGHMWETQRGVAPTALQNPDMAPTAPGQGYAIPNRAAELLAPYYQPRVA